MSHPWPPKGYEWDYLGPDPNDPSGEKWGWINEEGERWFEPGDRLPTGEEFIGYTEDGSPMWKEPVNQKTKRKFALKTERKFALEVEDGMIILYIEGKRDTNYGFGVGSDQLKERLKRYEREIG